MAPARRPVRRVTEAQAWAYDEQGFFFLEHALDAEALRMLAAEIAPYDERALEFLRTQPEGRSDIAGVDTVWIALHLVKHSAGPALLLFVGTVRRPLPRPRRARRASVLGPGGLQAAARQFFVLRGGERVA